MRKVFVAGIVPIALAAAACSQTTSSSAHLLSPTERQALAATLLGTTQIGIYGPVASQALAFINEVGQLSVTTEGTTANYNAVGLWFDIHAFHSPDTITTQFFATLAWQGTTSTISKITLVLGAGNTAPVSDALSSSFNGATGGTGMFGGAPYGANDVYLSNQGTFAVSAVSFGGQTSFTQGTMNGSYGVGTLAGTFNFQGVNASSAAKHQTADFTTGLPAVQLIVRGTF
jgi:hypothetical protein